MNYDINICSVSLFNADHIRINMNLVQFLNIGVNVKWIITENIADNQRKIDPSNKDLILLKGTHVNEIGAAALQHSIALNKTLKYIDSRFILIIDPDFFLVKKNWINKIIKHMENKELAMFGVPWHPKWYFKYRSFPCSHCLFIDTNKIKLDEIDFRPTNIVWDNPEYVFSKTISGTNRKIPLYHHIKNSLNFYIYHRRKIGFDGDTTSRIYLKFKHLEAIECAVPVFYPDRDWYIPISYNLNRYIEKVLPDRLSYIHSSNIKWIEKGFINKNNLIFNWEEFFWENEPLGFHVRGFPKRKSGNKEFQKEIDGIEKTLTQLTGITFN